MPILASMIKNLIVLVLMATPAQASIIDYLATGQTGAKTQIDTAHTSSWIMTPTINFSLGGGIFTMKDGSSSTDTVTLSLYQGVDDTGTLLAQIALTNSVFCGQVGNCGSFNSHDFFFTSAIALSSGVTYFAELTTPAANAQNVAYFIRDSTYFISDSSGLAVNPRPVTFGAPAPSVLEPRTVLLFPLGFAALFFVSRSPATRTAWPARK